MRLAALTTAALAAVTLIAAPCPANAAPTGTGWHHAASTWTPISRGHVDAPEIGFSNGTLTLGLGTHDHGHEPDPATTFLHLNSVIVNGKDAARFTVPGGALGSALSFLGPEGTTLWYAPQAKPADNGPLWVGYASHLSSQQVSEGTLKLTLTNAVGPGTMEAFTINAAKKTVQRLWSSVDPAARTVSLPTHVHGHCGWTFSAPGTYRLTFLATGTTPAGAQLTSAPLTITWQVGPGSPS